MSAIKQAQEISYAFELAKQ